MRHHDSRLFADRAEAGNALADALLREVPALHELPDTVVCGLARGGVPVARQVADRLNLALEVLVVRKVGAPGQPEYAMGALCAGMVSVNDDVPNRLGVSEHEFDDAVDREAEILADREGRYRAGRAPITLAGNTIVLVDDGIATGTSMSVAVRAVEAAGAVSVIVAVPTAPADIIERLRACADAVVVVETPDPFRAVGYSYDDFHQVDDDEVIVALQR